MFFFCNWKLVCGDTKTPNTRDWFTRRFALFFRSRDLSSTLHADWCALSLHRPDFKLWKLWKFVTLCVALWVVRLLCGQWKFSSDNKSHHHQYRHHSITIIFNRPWYERIFFCFSLSSRFLSWTRIFFCRSGSLLLFARLLVIRWNAKPHICTPYKSESK